MVAIDIVLPCYNPGGKWTEELESFYAASKEKYDIRFIVVNDGTPGGKVTGQVQPLLAKKIPVRLIEYQQNKGKGFALRAGVNEASRDLVVYTDIDFPFTTESMWKVMSALSEGRHDVIAGYRGDAYYQKKMSGFRKLLSRAFRIFLKNVLRISITDTQCGLKGFNAAGKKKFMATTINRYLFDFEFIYTSCNDTRLSVGAVEVQLKDNVIFSRMRPGILFQESINLVRVLLGAKN